MAYSKRCASEWSFIYWAILCTSCFCPVGSLCKSAIILGLVFGAHSLEIVGVVRREQIDPAGDLVHFFDGRDDAFNLLGMKVYKLTSAR